MDFKDLSDLEYEFFSFGPNYFVGMFAYSTVCFGFDYDFDGERYYVPFIGANEAEGEIYAAKMIDEYIDEVSGIFSGTKYYPNPEQMLIKYLFELDINYDSFKEVKF